MSSYLDVAVEAALVGGSILVEEFARPVDISYKGDVDIVTQADKRSENAVVSRLRASFPGHTIIAEEGGGGIAEGSPFRWYVDPLDGTTNFAHGYPCFAVSIGLEEAGELVAGVIYQPIAKEMFTAVKGGGAYLNGKPIHVSGIPKLGTGLLATGFPTHDRAQTPNMHYYRDFTLSSHGVRRDGSAAMDLAAVACGRFDGFWEFGLHSWDTAAGVLLVREAGGAATRFSGQPYRPGDPEILASNGHIHQEMREIALDIAARVKSGVGAG